MVDDADLIDDGESAEPEVDHSRAVQRGENAQALLDAVRADTARLREIQRWIDGVLEREARLTAYLRGAWLGDRDKLFTAGVGEGALDVFDEDAPWDAIARAQAARRAVHHALAERD